MVDKMITGKLWEEGRLGPERIELATRGGSGGRSWGRRPSRGPLMGLAGFCGEVERCRGKRRGKGLFIAGNREGARERDNAGEKSRRCRG